jgi:colanic acid/amylovoran biosynthesis protein
MAFNAQLIMDNLRMVIKDILDNTDSAVALIPHVAWEDNNDWLPLSVLYKTFKNSNRVCLIEDQSAQKLKWIISKCSCFIGARTHATIAAYSTGVPTLALGYSVKSKGIAQDIFGTAENYVVPYQDIVTKDTILSHYKWIKKHSYEIREVLLNKTNEYQKIILETGKILKDRYYNS